MNPALAMVLGGLGGCVLTNGLVYLGFRLWERRHAR